jgi:hypothetical protein
MNEYQQFKAMLERAGIGHGLRHDYNPDGESVQVEHDDEDAKHGWMVTDWSFDADGKLVSVTMYEGENC